MSFSIGDTVKYSREFLRNTGQFTGDAPFMEGTITNIIEFSDRKLCTIAWSPEYESNVLDGNLILKSRLNLELA